MALTSHPVRRHGWLLSPFGVAVAALTVVVGLRAADPGIVVALRDLTFDAYQRFAPRPSTNLPIRIVSIDERSLSSFGQWPWPRTRLAQLTEGLHELGAAAVVYSVLFAEPDRASPAKLLEDVASRYSARAKEMSAALAGLPDNDEVFASAARSVPTVLGFGISPAPNERRPDVKAGLAYSGASPVGLLAPFRGATIPLPVLGEAARGIGGLGFSSDTESGVVRRVPLLFSDGKTLYPSLALEALRVAQDAGSILVRTADSAGLAELRVGDFHVPLTARGEVWMHFDRDRPERYVSAAEILDAGRRPAMRDAVEGHIVFVGATASGLADGLLTPLGEVVPGVAVHAQLAEQILTGAYLYRPDWADGAELVATIVLGFAVVALSMLLGSQFSFVAGAFIAAAALAASWAAFSRAGFLIDPIYPSLGALAVHLAVTGAMHVTTDRDRRFVRRAFGQYLAPQLLAELEKAPHRMQLGGEIRPLTILFMDVRSFTPISESLTAVELVDFLNKLLSPLSEAIQEEGGTIDKYIGDSIMAFWNAPLDVPDHARRACRAALRMREILRDLNGDDAFGFYAAQRPEQQVRIGVGINTGEACVGNMGSRSRFNYSAIGDAVNVSARIESCSKELGADLLISEETARFVSDFALLEVGHVPLKGKARPTKLFALLGDETLAATVSFKEMARLHEELLAAVEAGDARKTEALAEVCQRVADPHFAPLFDHFKQKAKQLAGPEGEHKAPVEIAP